MKLSEYQRSRSFFDWSKVTQISKLNKDNAVTDYNQATTREDVPTTSTESLKENVRPTFTEIDNTSEYETKSTINDVRNNSQHTTNFEHTGNVD